MRPSGYEPDELPTAPPRDIKLNLVIGAEDRNRTGTVSLPQDFKSCASACSATSAYMVAEIGLEPTTPRV